MPTNARHPVVTTDAQIDAAIERGRRAPVLRVVAAAYDEPADEIAVRFENGARLAIPRRLIEGLTDAAAAQLREIQIAGPGTGLYWPRLDVAHHVRGLVDGVFGTRQWMREIARVGGATRSPAKAAAARANGAKGGWPKGRPRKPVSEPAAAAAPGSAKLAKKKVAAPSAAEES
jgi:Protein of unknown function (DUF2442)